MNDIFERAALAREADTMLRLAQMGSQVASAEGIEENVRDALQMVTQKDAGQRKNKNMPWPGNWERVLLNNLVATSALVLDKRWPKVKEILNKPEEGEKE
ncbi:MAG: hypothetical protein PHE09_16655 [Oscillospiraceae bacterium]|nr:hypothetical protein [Oscillospiraceae bacterium]